MTDEQIDKVILPYFGNNITGAMRELYRHFARAILAAATPGGWQPIETAPKTGRTILLGKFNSHRKWRTMRGQWMSADEIAETWEDPEFATEGWYETVVESDDLPNCWFIDEPSHWMPLPQPPKE